MTRESIPNNYFNIKTNIASSENENNALLQRRYNEFNPYLRPIRKSDSKVKDTMEFRNCVVFIRENDPDLSKHREFQDTEWHYYALGNIGDSKKTDKTRVNDAKDPMEAVIEIMDYNLPLSEFPRGDEALALLDADKFDESGTYGWRYLQSKVKDAFEGETDGMTEDDIAKNLAYEKKIEDAWKEFYRFVVNSTDEEFHDNLKNYFVVDSALFYYLFTERYTMVDNRAKNSFWHYGKCEDGVYRWDLTFAYDMDKQRMSM